MVKKDFSLMCESLPDAHYLIKKETFARKDCPVHLDEERTTGDDAGMLFSSPVPPPAGPKCHCRKLKLPSGPQQNEEGGNFIFTSIKTQEI